MSTQTILNIVLSAATVYLAIRNFALTSKKESQRESAEMAEIRTQLAQVMSMLRDLQGDMKSLNALTERVVAIETKLSVALDRIKKLEEDHGRN